MESRTYRRDPRKGFGGVGQLVGSLSSILVGELAHQIRQLRDVRPAMRQRSRDEVLWFAHRNGTRVNDGSCAYTLKDFHLPNIHLIGKV
jgi:hypothetical protein